MDEAAWDDAWDSDYINRDFFQENVSADELVLVLGWIEQNAYVEGAHHKQWVIDQIVRRLLLFPETYAEWRAAVDADASQRGLPLWDEGIAP